MASNFSFTFDDSDMQKLLSQMGAEVEQLQKKVSGKMADTINVLSQNEVPLDTGTLQGSVASDWNEADKTQDLSYNTDYAAYQHEGVRADGSRAVLKHGHGRKSKYLEDPIKNNLSKLQEVARKEFEDGLSVLR